MSKYLKNIFFSSDSKVYIKAKGLDYDDKTKNGETIKHIKNGLIELNNSKFQVKKKYLKIKILKR